MKLVIVHYHLRPSGVRRIIELATPHLVRQLGGATPSVTLVSGEAPDARWRAEFAEHLAGVPVECCVIPGCAYLSEQRRSPSAIALELRSAFSRLLAGCRAGNCLVWAHNLGLGRNPVLARQLEQACAAGGIPLLAHHHDWWFDNRWPRWNEMKRAGWPTLKAAAHNVFLAGTNVFHLAINQADARILRRHFGARAAWLPNLTEPAPRPSPVRVRAARAWLREQLGAEGPVWLMPCRLLRRKNVAEALLLTRWLRPAAWLVTTGGVSSADEMAYAKKLAAAARQHGWPLRLGVLQRNETGQPSVAELLAASEAVLLTSLQEGFGLPYLEAAAARRPLIARLLANVAPDLAQFGFRFPQGYQEILIDPRLFDWNAEQRRQQKLFSAWRAQLPGACRAWAAQPALLAGGKRPHPAPFSRLTLTAQLEVLVQPPEHSWALCGPWNPFLAVWRRRAAAGGLQPTPWPRRAARWLSGKVYAQRLQKVVRARPASPARHAAVAAQVEFIRERLAASNLFALLWNRET